MSEIQSRNERVYDILEEYIDPEILINLEGIKSDYGLEHLFLLDEDEPHRDAHIIEVKRIYITLAEELNILPNDLHKGLTTISWHDTGYKLVNAGLINYEQHHYASAFLASHFVKDPEIIEAILLHVEDVLPEDTQLWIRLVRDADRISALGFIALNRLAKYRGYKDPNLDQELGMREGIYVGIRKDRVGHDFDQREAFKYFVYNVLPFLLETNQLIFIVESMLLSLYRIEGGYDYEDNLIEPVIYNARQIFSKRINITRILCDDLISDNLHNLDPKITKADIEQLSFWIKHIGGRYFDISRTSGFYLEFDRMLENFIKEEEDS